MKQRKTWQDYMWIFSLSYLVLGFFNILFAWLGLICLFIPIVTAAAGGNKYFCNRLCGRGQLLTIIGGKISLQRDIVMLPVSQATFKRVF